MPLALILLLLAELGGAPTWLLHAAGLALLGGRMAHAHGVSRVEEDHRYRVVGMALTFASIIVLALRVLGGALLLPI